MTRQAAAAVAIVAVLLAPVAGGRTGTSPPEVVLHGRKPAVRACADCHRADGIGRPESASLAALPAIYIEQQIADYRRGVRRGADAGAEAMAAIAAAADERDIREASEYFAALPFTPRIRVVESEGGSEIVEQTSGDGFLARVPLGAVAAGERLVTTGGRGRTVRCALCHGDDLAGLGPVPGLAGRSPGYVVRQLRDMQRGARRGLVADLMKATVARLTERDMTAIAAYTASRRP